MKRSAMSLVELVIGMALLTLLAGTTNLSPHLYQHSAKREAEKLYSWLSQHALTADRTNITFKLEVESNKIKIIWQKPDIAESKQTEVFPSGEGCSYSWNAPNNGLYYSHYKNCYTQGATITIKGKGPDYYVIIAAVGGRVRISDVPPGTNNAAGEYAVDARIPNSVLEDFAITP